MALLKIKSNKLFNTLFKPILIMIAFLTLIFFIAFFKIIYEGLEKIDDYTGFCYALFAANAIICNTLFNLGRSLIFIKKFGDEEQMLIYNSGLMFLYASILTFLISGYAYFSTANHFASNSFIHNLPYVNIIIILSLTLFVGSSIICSISGLVYFFKWFSRALEISAKKSKEEINRLENQN